MSAGVLRWVRAGVPLSCVFLAFAGSPGGAFPSAYARDGKAGAREEAHAASMMARVGPGLYRPLYAPTPKETTIPVRAFLLDRLPVTNAEFASFVRANPSWQRGRPPRIFAEESYLSQWSSDTDPGPAVDAQAPVVRVSWFAAKAYCASKQARLPTEAEWELAAAASTTNVDGSGDAVWRDRITDWYAHPSAARLSRVGQDPANFWGIHNLHGLIWEWVLDYNSSLVTGDSRESGDQDKMRFCGAGALGAGDKTDYVKFMRVAFRSSLRADFTTNNLGFRCAKDLEETRR